MCSNKTHSAGSSGGFPVQSCARLARSLHDWRSAPARAGETDIVAGTIITGDFMCRRPTSITAWTPPRRGHSSGNTSRCHSRTRSHCGPPGRRPGPEPAAAQVVIALPMVRTKALGRIWRRPGRIRKRTTSATSSMWRSCRGLALGMMSPISASAKRGRRVHALIHCACLPRPLSRLASRHGVRGGHARACGRPSVPPRSSGAPGGLAGRTAHA